MSEQQWYCPNCGPEISVTVERIHTFSGPDDYIVCTGCGETVDEKAETPAFVLALQKRIATLEAACEASRKMHDAFMRGEGISADIRVKADNALHAAGYPVEGRIWDDVNKVHSMANPETRLIARSVSG